MIWTDAANEILKKEGKSLNYKDLTQKILKAKLVETQSKTPHITLHASIGLENKAREESGLPIRFILEKGEVSLTEWSRAASQVSFVQQTKRVRDSSKAELLKRLRELSGDKFESYIEALLVKMGYQNVELRGGPSDEGIDLLCQMSQGINQVKTGVQAKCKQAHKRVGPKDVRLLRDVLPKFQCSQGVLITTSSFTNDAKEAANEQGRLPIILIDSDKLAELAIEHEVGVKAQQLKTYFVDSEFELFK
jgi:restriction endonuclease Mrr